MIIVPQSKSKLSTILDPFRSLGVTMFELGKLFLASQDALEVMLFTYCLPVFLSHG